MASLDFHKYHRNLKSCARSELFRVVILKQRVVLKQSQAGSLQNGPVVACKAVLDCDWALAHGHRSAAVFVVRGASCCTFMTCTPRLDRLWFLSCCSLGHQEKPIESWGILEKLLLMQTRLVKSGTGWGNFSADAVRSTRAKFPRRLPKNFIQLQPGKRYADFMQDSGLKTLEFGQALRECPSSCEALVLRGQAGSGEWTLCSEFLES